MHELNNKVTPPPQLSDIELRRCKYCWNEKPLDQFTFRKDTNKYREKCKKCRNSDMSIWEKNQRRRQYDLERYYTNLKRKLYVTYKNMEYRCTKPFNCRYFEYWARGIKVEWETFEDFYRDMLPSYIEHIKKHWSNRENCQIDRIDNDGNYRKDNCRRVTAAENTNNRSI